MRYVQITSHAGERIRSFLDWKEYALPPDRRERHWKEGRSAFELGRSWTANGEPTAPCELTELLDSHEETRRVVILNGITEHETTLPFSSRGARCHDLSLRAEQDGHGVTICIEAKANESFGGTVAQELHKARRRPVTKFPERLDWLTRSLLGIPAFKVGQRFEPSDVISMLQYQLFSGVAGTLLEAKLERASKAVFLVHEFRTLETADAKIEGNANALNNFLSLLQSTNEVCVEKLEVGHIIGPILIIQRPVTAANKIPCDIPLFVGKLRTDRRDASA